MRRLWLLLFAMTAPVWAAPESVTVTADKALPPQVIDQFIQSFAAPTTVLGKLARWETPICPIAVGLRPTALKFLLQKLKDTAAQIGAPVDANDKCRANIEIVFTTTPQQLLDNIRKEHAIYLGYASDSAQADRLAAVHAPIQAWYTTATKGLDGQDKIDSSRTIGLGDSDEFSFTLGGMGNVTGFHMRDGRKSTLYHAIIVIDPTKLADHEIGGIADYVSFLALSQLETLNQCQPLASIMNMLVPDCPTATAMTQNDIAFLRGLYTMSLDGNLRMQTDGIRSRMIDDLAK
jgi:hypothetical protein